MRALRWESFHSGAEARQAPLELRAGHRALAQYLPAAFGIESGEVDDRRRLAAELPPVDRQVGPGEDRRGDVIEAMRRRLAARVGTRLEDGAPRAGEGALDEADAQALRILPTGEGVAPPGVVDHGRHGAGQQRPEGIARARAERREKLAHRERRKEHHRRGLALVAALEGVDAVDGGAVERVAREPVQGVGGEHGDAAGADAALELGPRPLRAGGGDADRTDHLHPTTTRSFPARSRRVSGRSNPAPRISETTSRARPAPPSSASTPAS